MGNMSAVSFGGLLTLATSLSIPHFVVLAACEAVGRNDAMNSFFADLSQ